MAIKKIKLVVKSTLAAETLSLVESVEECFMIKTILKEVSAIEGKDERLPIICVTDNRSLANSAYSTKTLTDKRLKVDISIIREMLVKRELHKITWMEKGNQLPDCLTKSGASSLNLLQILDGKTELLI